VGGLTGGCHENHKVARFAGSGKTEVVGGTDNVDERRPDAAGAAKQRRVLEPVA